MTLPITTEALVEARELVRQSLKGGAPGLTEATREAVVGSIMLKLTNKVLAPLLAAYQQVTAEREEDRAEHARYRASAEEVRETARRHGGRMLAEKLARSPSRWAGTKPEAISDCSPAHIMHLVKDAKHDIAVLLASLATANAELAQIREDAARLDFLDSCNVRLNAAYGTHYGWKLVLNHNVNRLVLGDMKVDLHDSEGGNDKLPSCRLAIDEARRRTALAHETTAREGA